MLSTTVPIIVLFGAAFFFVKYIIDKYNLLYVYPKDYETNQSGAWKWVLYFIIFSIMIYQIVMLGCLVWAETSWPVISTISIFILFGSLICFFCVRKVNPKLRHKMKWRDAMIRDKFSKGNRLNVSPNTGTSSFLTSSDSSIEIPKDIADLLTNAYLHPCEKTTKAKPKIKQSRWDNPFKIDNTH